MTIIKVIVPEINVKYITDKIKHNISLLLSHLLVEYHQWFCHHPLPINNIVTYYQNNYYSN